MTPEQFDNTKFRNGMKVNHVKYGKCTITGVDFDERLINVEIPEFIGDNWCRCENVELIPDNTR